jgi:Ethanolamine utilization protein EutJ (predicted chaperonin)
MAMIGKLACLVVVGLVLCAAAIWAAQTDKEKAAVAAAEKWLALVDQGQYKESWKEAAEYFRNSVKEDQWVQAVRPVREPLGKLLSRKVKSSSYVTELPGAPDAEYVVVQFETSFENKKSAVETVTPMLEKDGQWRVSGYYIE